MRVAIVVTVVVVGIADWNVTAAATSPTGAGLAVGRCAGGFVGSC